MHDTALEIGRLAIDIYAGGPDTRILELGSMNVNGSLRQFKPQGSHYTGVDLEEGDGVDMVVEAGKPLPFANDSFDMVLASSVFEHDPAFWATFIDLLRVLRSGGHLYINAPSNGQVHRYPEDNWRFYPDSGRALERWAASQGVPVRLIESFTAPRDKDIWNDFVAVFRKGESEKGLSGRFLHTELGGTNAWTLGASKPLKPAGPTEDMQLLKAERANGAKLAEERDRAIAHLKEYKDKAAADAATLQSTLRQREEEIVQTRNELHAAKIAAQHTNKLKADIAEANGWVFRLSGERQKAEKLLGRAEKRAGKAEVELAALRSSHRIALERHRQALDDMRQQAVVRMAAVNVSLADAEKLKAAERSVAARFDELTTMTRLLQEAEQGRSKSLADGRWLVEVNRVLTRSPWWWSLLPRSWRRKNELERLKKRSLFDGQRYLQLYPDVAAEGMDPLAHYMLHGMEEGRTLVR